MTYGMRDEVLTYLWLCVGAVEVVQRYILHNLLLLVDVTLGGDG